MKQWDPTSIRVDLEKTKLFSPYDFIYDKLSHCPTKTLFPNEILIEEGTVQQQAFYFLLEGILQVTTPSGEPISEILSGHFIGESVFFEQEKRMATVKAKTKATILIITVAVFDKLNLDADTKIVLLKRFHNVTLKFLRNSNQKALIHLKEKRSMGLIIINITVFFSVYSLFVPLFSRLIQSMDPTFVTTPLVLIGTLLLFLRIKQTKMPLYKIGITKKHLKKSIVESLMMTTALIALIFIFSYVFIRVIPEDLRPSLHNALKDTFANNVSSHLTLFQIIITSVPYPIHAFFQELLARGALQGMFEEFIVYKHKALIAIVLSNLIFTSAHIYFGNSVMSFVFAFGLFWGWLYSRQKNIVGVGLSHAIIGVLFLSDNRKMLGFLIDTLNI